MNNFHRRGGLVVILTISGITWGSGTMGQTRGNTEQTAQRVIDEYVAKYKPLDREVREAWFRYATTGDKKASKRQGEIELAMRTLDSDPNRFAVLKKLHADCNSIKDATVRRQVELLYLSHLGNQVTPEKLARLTDTERKVEEGFNDYRAEVDGKRLSPVEVDHILRDSQDSKELEKVWKAHASVGKVLEKDFREMVTTRNDIARDLGFHNYIELMAVTNEIDLAWLRRFYKDLTHITDKPFRELKEQFIDPQLAAHYGIAVAALQPWHYQNPFFQEAPLAIFEQADLDALYAKIDANEAIELTVSFYKSFGIDIAPIVKRSSLFPAEGKDPHASAWYLNRDHPHSSVLVMNLPNPPEAVKANDVATLVHELSHDIHFEATLANQRLPYLLKSVGMLTEAVAMLFENQAQTRDWFVRLGVKPDKAQHIAEAVELIDYVDQLVFARWTATMFCFEDRFYADPNQDIGDLWWSCREKFQFVKRPRDWKNPDALAKAHIPTVSPLYYSHYAIGRIVNAQFVKLLAEKIGVHPRGASYFGHKELGAWLMSDFLATGDLERWNEFIQRTTGKPLSMDAWEKFYLDAGLEKRLFQ
ncbi:MAG: M2 family metallopeptidase [Deltaproteobacteria bacterium]|nr:M2 family metallopeptidase [Deltaproteobacteria bacterium]